MILHRLVTASPGALGAVLSDDEGETVDYFSAVVDPEELMLAAAYMGILAGRLAGSVAKVRGGGLVEVCLKGQRLQFVARLLGLGYHLTVVLDHAAVMPKLLAAMEQAVAELRVEAGGVLD
jgi:predicted regulator of Ras-like GTPase activity (Roadblock/LC7/MglB family)